VHLLGFTGVSLKVRASCRTVVFSMFWKGFPPPENKFKRIYSIKKQNEMFSVSRE